MKKKPVPEPEVQTAIALDDKSQTCRVTVIQDSILEYPDLWLEVFIAGGPDYDRAMVQMFAKARCFQAKSVEQADLVIFTGGPDVNPVLYLEEDVHPKTNFDSDRDKADIELFYKAQELGIPMVGICRGSQLLHVMKGGRLFQHIEGHTGPHSMLCSRTQRLFQRISSTHHQGVIYHDGMQIIGESLHKNHDRWLNGTTKDGSKQVDIEAYFYRQDCILGFQGHPEFMGYGQYSQWCMQQIEHFIKNNPDIVVTETDHGRFNRLKKELILNPM